MSIEAFEKRDETLKLRAKLETTEQARCSRAASYALEESRKRLEAICQRDCDSFGTCAAGTGRSGPGHLHWVGSNSARKITNLILDALARLERFHLSVRISQDKELRGKSYRHVIAGKCICVPSDCRHGVCLLHCHGASNYPTLFKQLLKELTSTK